MGEAAGGKVRFPRAGKRPDCSKRFPVHAELGARTAQRPARCVIRNTASLIIAEETACFTRAARLSQVGAATIRTNEQVLMALCLVHLASCHFVAAGCKYSLITNIHPLVLFTAFEQ